MYIREGPATAIMDGQFTAMLITADNSVSGEIHSNKQ